MPKSYRKKLIKSRKYVARSRPEYRGFGYFGGRRVINRGFVKSLMPSTYHFKQMINGSNIQAIGQRRINQTTGSQTWNLEFFLNQVPQVATFTSLFDQYRINKIVVKLFPMVNQVVTTDVASGLVVPRDMGMLATIIDFDGGAGPTTLDAFQEYQNCKVQQVVNRKVYTRIFTPRTLGSIQVGGGSVTSAQNRAKQWIDTAHTNVTHYGLKIYMDGGNLYNLASYDVQATFYLSFRNVR